jgi:hypothetical protein
MSEWQDRIVGARMAVDDEYAATIDNSQFSRQEWGLIMTAVEFDIREAADEQRAQLFADTSSLPQIMPEVEKVAEMNAMGGPQQPSGGGGGILGGLKDALGLGGSGGGTTSVDQQKVEAAERLVDGYASELQAYLEDEGRWTEVREVYVETTE